MYCHRSLFFGALNVLVLLAPLAVYAHGPQIQVGVEDSRIVTRALYANEPYNDAVTSAQRVYEIAMTQRNLGDANDGWYAEPNPDFAWTGPGIATALGGFDTGSVLTQTFADGLKVWDGTAFVDPGVEQIDAYRGVAHTAGAITSDAGPFGSFSYTAITNTGDEHKTAYFRLLGDGVSPDTSSDDGIYLLSLRLLTDQPGISPSLPYYFLLNKNGSMAGAADALGYVNTHILPEPGTIGILASGALTLARRRRRR